MAMTVCINENAENINDIFFNEPVSIENLDDIDNVYKVCHEDKELNFLIKVFINKTLNFNKEIENLEALKEIKEVPNLVLYGKNPNFKFLLIEKFEAKDLFTYWKEKGNICEEEMKIITKKLLKILKEIHSNGITHYDIKPENILYDPEDSSVYIIDFEECRTQLYCPPEYYLGNSRNFNLKDSFKTDVWSLGITIYSLLFGCAPFNGKKSIVNSNLSFPKSIISANLKDLISKMLDKNINTRYDVNSCLKHSWFH